MTAAASLLALILSGCSALQPAATAEPPPLLETGRVKTDDGTKIYFARAGQGPAVIFIHGLGGNHAVWFHQLSYFARNYTAVAISQRGFAPSEGNGRDYDVERLVADLTTVMDYLGIERAHIVGQSMGGWTALGAALARPGRVRSLVLADTLAGISDEHIADTFSRMMAQARELAKQPPRLGVHPAIDAGFAAADPAHAYLYQALSSFGAPSPARIGPQLGAVRFKHDALERNRVPTLFVVGERDPIFPPDIVRHAAGYLGASRVVTLKDTGHSPYFEAPKAWNRVVSEYFASLP